jgi:hypothetical protein
MVTRYPFDVIPASHPCRPSKGIEDAREIKPDGKPLDAYEVSDRMPPDMAPSKKSATSDDIHL